MAIKREIIDGGIRLIHPSGITTTTSIENLRRHKQITQQMIAELQRQIDVLDQSIQAVEKLRATPPP